MKSSEELKLGKWILDMLFSIQLSTIQQKNGVDNSIGSWDILIQVKMQLFHLNSDNSQLWAYEK